MNDPIEFEADIKRLGELTRNLISITLHGGEPLLHPNIEVFPYLIRRHYPETTIIILTNGILIPSMQESFWKSIIDNDVIVAWDEYPTDKELNLRIEDTLKSKGIQFVHENKDHEKELGKWVYDFNKMAAWSNDERWQWLNCWQAGSAVQLRNHCIYPCAQAAYADILIKYFQLDVKMEKSDSINIYEIDRFEQIMDFLTHPIPFCRFCHIEKQTTENKWSQSEKKIEEWT